MLGQGLGLSATSGGSVPTVAWSSPPQLLDTYSGAVGAYSLRLLDKDYAGNCIKVRRASNDATQDIGFVEGLVDTSALETFCAGTDGYIDTWYDQSGNNNHCVPEDDIEGNPTQQPRIVSSGTSDGAVKFTANAHHLPLCDIDTNNTIFTVLDGTDTQGALYQSRVDGGSYLCLIKDGDTGAANSGVGTPVFYVDGVATTISTRDEAHTALMDGRKKLLTASSVVVSADDNNWTPVYVGDYAGGYDLNPASFYEIIIYPSHLSTGNIDGVEGNIMTYYSL